MMFKGEIMSKSKLKQPILDELFEAFNTVTSKKIGIKYLKIYVQFKKLKIWH